MRILLIPYEAGVGEPCSAESSGNWKLFHVVWRTDALGETQSKARPGIQKRLCVCSVFSCPHLYIRNLIAVN